MEGNDGRNNKTKRKWEAGGIMECVSEGVVRWNEEGKMRNIR